MITTYPSALGGMTCSNRTVYIEDPQRDLSGRLALAMRQPLYRNNTLIGSAGMDIQMTEFTQQLMKIS
ncbi:hypothetical protein FM037_14135 [Shewanella psychropiezotolerans]|uniref:Uncharacterized protein n=1 Tax=Shewanella psychropiezotolerans TaxID=2593655 RepID=A0ABX5X2J4_9GAMM|nr:hypothetical protein [Shewanella psychropiezotolerans]QDO84163.1 hypothetical protein FM037_14135 [Shewanella psychropiezotolerans]